MEEWREIEGYDGKYIISNNGKVLSTNYNKSKKTKELKIKYHNYAYVDLCKHGIRKRYSIHRLVASAFIPNPLNLPEVNHKDEDRYNNIVSNLEWCDRIYNVRYGTGIERGGISRGAKIRCIETDKIYNSSYEVQRELGCNQSDVIKCCKGKKISSGGLHFEYA